jgi:hypothetical protein
MVTLLQGRVPIGLSAINALAYLNEAFRKLDQLSKGGFIWQLKQANLALGLNLTVPAPADFDPGKSAWLRGNTPYTPTNTIIPYKPWSEFSTMQHFQTTTPGSFDCWTFVPNFRLTPAPTSYAWTILLAPDGAIVTTPPGPVLPFVYHSVNFAPFLSAANVYFPTPDQFDSMILDLAEAEAKRIYNLSGWDRLAQQANQAIMEIIDTYRTDRYDLAGLFDESMQSKEKQTEKDK